MDLTPATLGLWDVDGVYVKRCDVPERVGQSSPREGSVWR